MGGGSLVESCKIFRTWWYFVVKTNDISNEDAPWPQIRTVELPSLRESLKNPPETFRFWLSSLPGSPFLPIGTFLVRFRPYPYHQRFSKPSHCFPNKNLVHFHFLNVQKDPILMKLQYFPVLEIFVVIYPKTRRRGVMADTKWKIHLSKYAGDVVNASRVAHLHHTVGSLC